MFIKLCYYVSVAKDSFILLWFNLTSDTTIPTERHNYICMNV